MREAQNRYVCRKHYLSWKLTTDWMHIACGAWVAVAVASPAHLVFDAVTSLFVFGLTLFARKQRRRAFLAWTDAEIVAWYDVQLHSQRHRSF